MPLKTKAMQVTEQVYPLRVCRVEPAQTFSWCQTAPFIFNAVIALGQIRVLIPVRYSWSTSIIQHSHFAALPEQIKCALAFTKNISDVEMDDMIDNILYRAQMWFYKHGPLQQIARACPKFIWTHRPHLKDSRYEKVDTDDFNPAKHAGQGLAWHRGFPVIIRTDLSPHNVFPVWIYGMTWGYQRKIPCFSIPEAVSAITEFAQDAKDYINQHIVSMQDQRNRLIQLEEILPRTCKFLLTYQGQIPGFSDEEDFGGGENDIMHAKIVVLHKEVRYIACVRPCLTPESIRVIQWNGRKTNRTLQFLQNMFTRIARKEKNIS
jgi:hypothetical protein